MKCTRMFDAINNVIHVQILQSQKVVFNVSLLKDFTKTDHLPHVFPKIQFMLHFV